MKNLKIGTRLTIGFAFLLVIIATLTSLGSWVIHQSNSESLIIADLNRNEWRIAEWDKAIALNTSRMIAAARSTSSATQRYFEDAMAATTSSTQALRDELRENISADAEAVSLFDKIMQERAIFRDARDRALLARDNGDWGAAQRFVNQEMDALLSSYLGSVQDLLQYQQQLITDTVEQSYSRNQTAELIFIALAVISMIIGVILAYAITRSIVRPLTRALGVAQTVASRDLSTEIVVDRSDENGQLLLALQQMNHSLGSVISDVGLGASQVASTSEQILAGNQDLSSRTEEQASSLTETAAAMEELTTTVQQNADNAVRANELTASAAAIASRGGQIVSEVVTTMESINESSKRVEDIITVIDGIAFQTNILALNAAVESARAGEAGRGFAVVAGEVRSLAQRSAQAAHEIKDLINTSVDITSNGSRLANEAGDTMTQIVESIHHVTDIMSEISTASQEQSAGISQVNEAVIQMDEVTRQNAQLVEQAATAAGGLQEQAERLNRLVSTFKIGSDPRGNTASNGQSVVESLRSRITPSAPRAEVKSLVLSPVSTPGLASSRLKARPQTQDDWEEF